MAYADNQAAYSQEHFTVLEIDLPAFSSTQACQLVVGGSAPRRFLTSAGEAFITSGGDTFYADGEGYYTPLSCDQAWDGTTYKTYYFATANTPLQFGRPPSSSGMPGDVIEISDPIRRVIKGVSEQVTELRPGEGLAIQGSANVVLVDFDGDPGPVQSSASGTFFGKFSARNILVNKDARLKYYHKQAGNIYAADDALTHYYYVDTLKSNGKGEWTLSLKDELAKLDEDTHQFPEPTGGTLRADIDNAVTTIPVDATTDWEQLARPYTIKVGDEFMKVSAVTGNLTGSASLTVGARGVNIAYTNTLSTTVADEHTTGDDVQICYTSDNQDIDDFLYDVAIAAGIPAAVIPTADWAAEIAEWHPSDKINTIWHEPTPTSEVMLKVCTDFLLDMWFDTQEREVKLSAISVWKATGVEIEEGKGITAHTFRTTPKEDKRYSRAFVYFNKPDKILNDDIQNFRAISINIASAPESSGEYGEPKTREFDNSHILATNSAALLVQRTTARFGYTPNEYQWETEEKFLNFKTGDIATITTPEVQDFDGTNKQVRAQITSVQPVFGLGRNYRVKALTYEAAFPTGTEITVSTASNNINLHTLAGAPSGVVDLTFVISANIGSTSTGTPAITAGGFASGSSITIIVKDSALLTAAGGRGGDGGISYWVNDTSSIINGPGQTGDAGGTVYSADGIDTTIYLGGTIGSHTSLGTLYAPGGGGGGEAGLGVGTTIRGGDGGGGGAGSIGGAAGAGGLASEDSAAPPHPSSINQGVAGSAGTTTGGTAPGGAGAGGNYGTAGATGSAAGGAAGKGIVTGGATVTVSTSGNTGRIINGSGDSVTIT